MYHTSHNMHSHLYWKSISGNKPHSHTHYSHDLGYFLYTCTGTAHNMYCRIPYQPTCTWYAKTTVLGYMQQVSRLVILYYNRQHDRVSSECYLYHSAWEGQSNAQIHALHLQSPSTITCRPEDFIPGIDLGIIGR